MPVITLSTAPLLLLPLLIPVVLGYFFQVRPKQRQRVVQQGLQPGDRVVTGSGLHATVRGLDADIVDLEVCAGSTHRYERTSVVKVLYIR